MTEDVWSRQWDATSPAGCLGRSSTSLDEVKAERCQENIPRPGLRLFFAEAQAQSEQVRHANPELVPRQTCELLQRRRWKAMVQGPDSRSGFADPTWVIQVPLVHGVDEPKLSSAQLGKDVWIANMDGGAHTR